MAKYFTLNLACNKGHEYTTIVDDNEVQGVTKDGSLVINGVVNKGMYATSEGEAKANYVVIDITLPLEAIAYAANELNSPSAVVEEAVVTGSRSARIYISKSREEPK